MLALQVLQLMQRPLVHLLEWLQLTAARSTARSTARSCSSCCSVALLSFSLGRILCCCQLFCQVLNLKGLGILSGGYVPLLELAAAMRHLAWPSFAATLEFDCRPSLRPCLLPLDCQLLIFCSMGDGYCSLHRRLNASILLPMAGNRFDRR